MEPKTLAKLEFDQIIEKVSSYCGSNLGKEIAKQLSPSTDYEDIKRWQQETHEGVELLRLHPEVPLGGLKDVRLALKRVAIGATLEPMDLLEISDTLRTGRRLNKFFANLKEHYPLLQNQINLIGDFSHIESKINFAILPSGEIADGATPELNSIRRKIHVFQNRIKEKLDNILRNPSTQKMLQEAIVTIRGDRYVVPVKQEYRGSFPGIIHDQSASGATLFIEPQSVVEVNNQLRTVLVEEKQEVARILRNLTGLVTAELEDIKLTVDALAMVEFIFAKAKYAHELDAVMPKFNINGKLNIIKGRHPLIKGSVVPVSIHLGDEFSTLVITGPNTGGKTVTLKTVGLFVCMTQSGLHIPAEVGSEMGLLTNVFCDIGDEQSIEQSLSTFSSHMTNIINILDKSDGQSLVLFDEIGAGTDPTEGAALAMAILEELYSRGTKVIATTHYSQLKTFAYSTPEVENASVEFDTVTLRPTYRLLIGQPGRSNAFEISKRLGLSEVIVNRAKDFMSQEEVQVANLIESLEETQKAVEFERSEAEKLKEEIETLRHEYRQMQQELKSKREQIIKKAQEEALQIVKVARNEAEGVLTDLKEKITQEEGRGKLHAAQAARAKLRSSQYNKAAQLEGDEEQAPGEIPKTVKVGQAVFVPKFNQNANVLDVKGNKVNIQIGVMKLTVNLNELRIIKQSNKKVLQESGAGSIMANKAKHISNEIDLRGLMVEECIAEAEKYLDDAYLAGVSQVYLIHGKGTGALRMAINDMLKQNRHVKTWRLGEFGEGGTGVTVVNFKT